MKENSLNNKRILVTGGAGFIGGTLIRHLLQICNSQIFNLDFLNYSSNLMPISKLKESERQYFLQVDLRNKEETASAFKVADPDLVFHLAAETHVDRSIDNPEGFITSNILGTFNLLEAVREHWNNLNQKRKSNFRFIHISTDEVFGSCNENDYFNEESLYDPRSPYSASKASSDHLVNAWVHTYNIPAITTNCSNNYGPYQFPDKLIPISILKAINGLSLDLYGDGLQVRDWLFVDDHVEALLLIAKKGIVGKKYCIGGLDDQITNYEIVKKLCLLLNKYRPKSENYLELINFVKDRPGHDKRYAIDAGFLKKTLGWEPKYQLSEGLEKTVEWYLDNLDWSKEVLSKSKYKFQRLGTL